MCLQDIPATVKIAEWLFEVQYGQPQNLTIVNIVSCVPIYVSVEGEIKIKIIQNIFLVMLKSAIT